LPTILFKKRKVFNDPSHFVLNFFSFSNLRYSEKMIKRHAIQNRRSKTNVKLLINQFMINVLCWRAL
jgi:hypothetical protein